MHTLFLLPLAFDDCKHLPVCEGAGAAHSLLYSPTFATHGPQDHPGQGQVRPSHPAPSRCSRATLLRPGHRAEPPGFAGRGSLPSGRCGGGGRERARSPGGAGPGAPPAPPSGPASASGAPRRAGRPRRWPQPSGRAGSVAGGCLSRRRQPGGGAAGGARLSPGPVLYPLPPFSVPPSLPPAWPRAARPPAPPAAGAAPYGPRRCHEPGPGSPRR